MSLEGDFYESDFMGELMNAQVFEIGLRLKGDSNLYVFDYFWVFNWKVNELEGL
jgi:hypothetical protein